ncbi:hypothetical protein Bca52824_016123 [Brassica carinata]|uniref:Uncharacterized protein n=1 Tax=Brassica carinata TaxID=52824 RepID=A0A8X7W5T7_BRACI|nr:hypothetical protein Bca52824_016123 [Brassica carinata]
MPAASSAEKVIGGLPSGMVGQRLAVTAFLRNSFTNLTESLQGGDPPMITSLGLERVEVSMQIVGLAAIRDDRLWLRFGNVSGIQRIELACGATDPVRLSTGGTDCRLSDFRRSSLGFSVVDGAGEGVVLIVKILRRDFGFSSSEVESSSWCD